MEKNNQVKHTGLSSIIKASSAFFLCIFADTGYQNVPVKTNKSHVVLLRDYAAANGALYLASPYKEHNFILYKEPGSNLLELIKVDKELFGYRSLRMNFQRFIG